NACRRCGVSRYKEADCLDGSGKFIACNRADLMIKPGSASWVRITGPKKELHGTLDRWARTWL
ncbi:Hypothetical protein CINCED_3A017432, partial [Cinara cedri]